MSAWTETPCTTCGALIERWGKRWRHQTRPFRPHPAIAPFVAEER